MKFLLSLFISVSTAAYVQYHLPDPIPAVLRITTAIHANSPIDLTPTQRQGNNFDVCASNDDCNSPRLCLSSEEGVPPGTGCTPGNVCACAAISPPFCDTSDQCDEGESCATPPGVTTGLCVSDIVIANSGGNFNVVDGPNPTAPPPTNGQTTTTPPDTATTTTTTATTPTTTTTTTTTPTTTTTTTPTTTTTTTPTTTTTTTPTTTTTSTTTTTAAQPITAGGDDDGDGDDDDEVCFPASAVVHLANGEKIPMHQLSAGHQVQHDELGSSSKIFLFTHRTNEYTGWFYRITTESGHAITMTGNHYLYANGRLTSANAVNRGDVLRTVNGESRVARIHRVRGQGLYAPHSLHGDLVVDGIVVSGYSRAVNPSLAHALLAPVRWFVKKTGVVEPLGGLFYGGGRGFEKIIMKGADRY